MRQSAPPCLIRITMFTPALLLTALLATQVSTWPLSETQDVESHDAATNELTGSGDLDGLTRRFNAYRRPVSPMGNLISNFIQAFAAPSRYNGDSISSLIDRPSYRPSRFRPSWSSGRQNDLAALILAYCSQLRPVTPAPIPEVPTIITEEPVTIIEVPVTESLPTLNLGNEPSVSEPWENIDTPTVVDVEEVQKVIDTELPIVPENPLQIENDEFVPIVVPNPLSGEIDQVLGENPLQIEDDQFVPIIVPNPLSAENDQVLAENPLQIENDEFVPIVVPNPLSGEIDQVLAENSEVADIAVPETNFEEEIVGNTEENAALEAIQNIEAVLDDIEEIGNVEEANREQELLEEIAENIQQSQNEEPLAVDLAMPQNQGTTEQWEDVLQSENAVNNREDIESVASPELQNNIPEEIVSPVNPNVDENEIDIEDIVDALGATTGPLA